MLKARMRAPCPHHLTRMSKQREIANPHTRQFILILLRSEFFEEGWTAKLGRRMKEEPLIPLGCLATCYALYGASRAMRQGKSYDVNRYFRARIYAQGFTLVCIVAGGFYYKDARMERKAKEKRYTEKKAEEKRDRWIQELEARDREDQEWRARHEAVEKRAREAVQELKGEKAKKVKEEGQAAKQGAVAAAAPSTEGRAKSVIEEVERRGWGRGMWAVHELWSRS